MARPRRSSSAALQRVQHLAKLAQGSHDCHRRPLQRRYLIAQVGSCRAVARAQRMQARGRARFARDRGQQPAVAAAQQTRLRTNSRL